MRLTETFIDALTKVGTWIWLSSSGVLRSDSVELDSSSGYSKKLLLFDFIIFSHQKVFKPKTIINQALIEYIYSKLNGIIPINLN